MSALIDTNIFLDVLLDRGEFVDQSQAVLDWFDGRPGQGWIAWHTLANLYYVGGRFVGKKEALREIDAILEVFEVCPAHSQAARLARALPLADFEDALQVAAAREAGVEMIITRNVRDFARSPITALSPRGFLAAGQL